MSQHVKEIDEIGNEHYIKGVMIRIWWSDLETAWGTYDFSAINTYLATLKKQPTQKRLVVRIMDRKFNTTSDSGIVPNYLRTNALFEGGLVRTNTGYAARLWVPPVMSRLIALYKAIGWRFDSDPYFEGLFTEETPLGALSWDAPDYSNEALTDQYVRFVGAVKPALPTTNLFLNANWIGSSSLMSTLIQSLVEPRVGVGGSNTMPDKKTLGQRVVTGEFGADYRWELAIASGVETGELGGNLGNYTPKEIAEWAYNTLHVHYMFWTRNTWSGSAAQRWDTGILPYLRTNPPIRTGCPNSYGSCAR